MGTDGAANNIAAQPLKGLVEQKIPFLAHRLELAIKDALSGILFDSIDDMLLRLYYLYEKTPNRCIELESLCSDLKECLEFDENGIRPVRASETRWLSHKSVKAADRAKLK